jgi:hypothetical protein
MFFILILNTLKVMIILFQIFSLVNFCSATMARKKDKEKTYSKALVLKPKYTIAASPAISSIALTNRFLAFSPGPPISYFSTLASAYDPFVDSSQKPKAPFIKYDKPSAYVVVPYFQHLFSIEINRAHIKFSSQLVLSYFPPNFHWIPEHLTKNLSFYTNILIQTKSIHFKPIFCKTEPSKLLFHNVYFDKIISEKDWDDHPSSPRVLDGFDVTYCYYDYIEAWFKFMLFQTPKFDHSWFINFDKDFGGNLPI